jgi:hypothetical protein
VLQNVHSLTKKQLCPNRSAPYRYAALSPFEQLNEFLTVPLRKICKNCKNRKKTLTIKSSYAKIAKPLVLGF